MAPFTQQKFVRAARAKHGSSYDYSRAVYQHAHKKVTIICPKHGPFRQRAAAHLNGTGCPECGLVRKKEKGAAA